MRILHTSDWHLGRTFGDIRLLDDQRAFIDWLVEVVAADEIDLVAIAGDLYALTRGEAQGRQDDAEITLFKSVGAALEDLAAGIAVYRRFAEAGACGRAGASGAG